MSTSSTVTAFSQGALRFFDYHISPEGRINFLQDTSSSSGAVKAQVSNVQGTVSVKLPESDQLGIMTFDSTKLKIQQLLRNVHLKPIYLQELNEVQFVPISPEGKIWEKRAEISHWGVKHWVARLNGMITYLNNEGEITTWNWVDNSKKTEPNFSEAKKVCITAFSEKTDGSLIMGDKEGRVWSGGKIVFDTGKKEPIEKIAPLGPAHCLVVFKGNSTIIVDYGSEKILKDLGTSSSFFVVREEKIVVLSDSKLAVYQYNPSENSYQTIEHPYQQLEGIKEIKQVSSTKVLVFHEDVYLWDVEKNLKESCLDRGVPPYYLKKLVICLDDETLCVNDPTKIGLGNCRVSFFNKEGECFHGDAAGTWGILDMILLSDSTVMYATDQRGGQVHIVTRQGRVIFSKFIQDLAGHDGQIQKLKELADGSVAVMFRDNILILKPRIDQSEDQKYLNEKAELERKHQIEKYTLELKYNPDKISLYAELANSYTNTEKQYETYLSGLKAAIRISNFYQARRFYERARRIKKTDEEPCRFFLAYLQNSPHEKITRSVQLDLFKLTENPKDRPTPDKKIKERLFVGEGDFTYTEAFIKKHEKSHPDLSKAITASEFLSVTDKTVNSRIDLLKKKGVKIEESVDGRSIHEKFINRNFKRIHWNCPFGDNGSYESKEQFKKVIPQFFRSCRQLQNNKNRVHVTLVQGNEYSKERQLENPIVLGATSNAYRLIRKRRFGAERYPGYRHVKTGRTTLYDAGGQEMEFVFEKTDCSESDPLKLKDPSQKEYKVISEPPVSEESKMDLSQSHFECSTDDDSSDCYDSE